MAFPRPDDDTKAFFNSVLPDDPNVRARPMFGNLAGFVNGNMFMGVFGSTVFVRLADSDRSELLREEGTAILEVMEGRPMKEYVAVPNAWRDEPGRVRHGVARSLEWVGAMPPKKAKGR